MKISGYAALAAKGLEPDAAGPPRLRPARSGPGPPASPAAAARRRSRSAGPDARLEQVGLGAAVPIVEAGEDLGHHLRPRPEMADRRLAFGSFARSRGQVPLVA